MSLPREEAELNSSPPRRVPVWAPNPAVPLPARILAYLFAALALLTALLGMIPRPPDTPPEVKKWATYNSSHGCTLPYPAGWDMQVSSNNETDKIIIALLPDSPVQVMAMIRQFPEPVDASLLAQNADDLVAKLRDQFHNFTPRDDGKISDVADVERSFTFTDENKTAMAGTLTIRTANNSALLLISFAPQEGWSAMRQITGHMLEFAQFK